MFIIRCIEYRVVVFIKCICFFHAKTSAYKWVFCISLCSLLQLGDWVYEKMRMARDSSRDETQKLHKKWLKHQAFMAELAQNKEWLAKIEKVSVEGVSSPILIVFCVSSCFRIIPVSWSVPSDGINIYSSRRINWSELRSIKVTATSKMCVRSPVSISCTQTVGTWW